MSAHDKLVKQAYEAVDNLFGDTSVEAEETREDLQDLWVDIDIKIKSIKIKQTELPCGCMSPSTGFQDICPHHRRTSGSWGS
jgi:hypothetical protein